MKKFVHLQFNCNNKSEHAKNTLLIDNNQIPIHLKKGIWLTNICVDEKSSVSLKVKNENIKLIITKDKIFHPDQLAFDKKHSIVSHKLLGESVYYSLCGDIYSPKKILITFPGVSNFDNVHHRLSALSSLHSRLKNVLIISGLKARFSLCDHDIIFYGNSKGATIAIDYISFFPNSYFFIDIPQLDLYNKSHNALFKFTLGEDARNYYVFKETLSSLKNEKVYYSFAENDHDSSRSIPMRNFPGINVSMLKDMGHSGSAIELVKKNFAKIFQLITEKNAINRPNVNINYSFKNGKLYVDRVLPAFDKQQKADQVYAEIKFQPITQSPRQALSVSLNKHFDHILHVYWKHGFDILNHLDQGEYIISLHVYYNFDEFIYPLNKRIIVHSNNISIINHEG
ncbi:TPA: hypothetical protein ACW0JC_000772 [Escherichia coli]